MAGGHGNGHNPVNIDPAVQRYSKLHSTMYQRFQMTPTTTRRVIVLGFAIPLLTYQAVDYGNRRWDLQGKRRDEPLLRQEPTSS